MGMFYGESINHTFSKTKLTGYGNQLDLEMGMREEEKKQHHAVLVAD